MNDATKLWWAIKETFGSEVLAASLSVLVRDGNGAVMKSFMFPQEKVAIVDTEKQMISIVDCRRCSNRGTVYGLSQETCCEHCKHETNAWKADLFEEEK